MWASLDLTGGTSEALATVASPVAAETISVAPIGALNHGAVEAGVSGVALASPVHADASVGAVIGARPQRAILANKARLAEASGIVAKAITGAVVRALAD